METRVQVAAHFTIDPAKQVIGAIQYPEQVTVTLSAGEQIQPKKVAFDVAFTAEQKEEIEKLLTPMIIESGRTAKPKEEPAGATAPVVSPATPPTSEPEEEEGESLF